VIHGERYKVFLKYRQRLCTSTKAIRRSRSHEPGWLSSYSYLMAGSLWAPASRGYLDVMAHRSAVIVALIDEYPTR
jgi:hypothetical protein